MLYCQRTKNRSRSIARGGREGGRCLNCPDYTVLRSKRRTLAIEIQRDLRVLVRAPLRMPEAEIAIIVREKADWIARHQARLRERTAQRGPALSAEELQQLRETARVDLAERLARFAPLVGAEAAGLCIRSQKSRWGSCSARGNISLNCLLMLCPPPVRDYVVVHELVHRLELNHSPRFWAQVERVLPDYRERRQWLKEQGNDIIGRLR